MLAFVSCASRPPPYQEQGWASYVADFYTGRPTSSGEIYYPQAYTAAHTTLPFGTVVRVKNIMNGRTVNVTINDRFPYYQGRIINLSSVAAQEIGIPYMQMGQVEITAANMASNGYAQQPSTSHRGYAQQQSTSQRGYQPQQQAAYPPAQSSGAYAPQSSPYPGSAPSGGYQVQPAAGAPNAPGYNGASSTPPGLRTY